ncbi:unknown [Clostridium sp. CAG:505]|nr:unknown [Clostridium sp. CAG:505]
MKSIKWMLFGMTLLLVTFLIRCMLEDVLYTDFIGIFGVIIVLYGMCKNEKQ